MTLKAGDKCLVFPERVCMECRSVKVGDTVAVIPTGGGHVAKKLHGRVSDGVYTMPTSSGKLAIQANDTFDSYWEFEVMESVGDTDDSLSANYAHAWVGAGYWAGYSSPPISTCRVQTRYVFDANEYTSLDVDVSMYTGHGIYGTPSTYSTHIRLLVGGVQKLYGDGSGTTPIHVDLSELDGEQKIVLEAYAHFEGTGEAWANIWTSDLTLV